MRYGQLRGKWISQPEHKSDEVSCSRVTYCLLKYKKTNVFSKFSLTITGKYLFIFGKLEENNICFPISSSFRVLFTNPRNEWFGPIMIDKSCTV